MEEHYAFHLAWTATPTIFVESLGLHTYHDSSWGKDVHPFGGYVVMLNKQWSRNVVSKETQRGPRQHG